MKGIIVKGGQANKKSAFVRSVVEHHSDVLTLDGISSKYQLKKRTLQQNSFIVAITNNPELHIDGFECFNYPEHTDQIKNAINDRGAKTS